MPCKQARRGALPRCSTSLRGASRATARQAAQTRRLSRRSPQGGGGRDELGTRRVSPP